MASGFADRTGREQEVEVSILRFDGRAPGPADFAAPGLATPRWFDRPEVLAACARTARAEGSEPVLCVIERDGRPVFQLPLRLRRRLGVMEALPLAAPLAQDVDAIGEAPDALPALQAALSTRLGVDLLVLRKLRADGALARALVAGGIAPFAASAAPFIDLAGFGDFAGYEAAFSSSTRRKSRQRRQAAEKALGALSFRARPLGEEPGDRAALAQAITWKRAWLAEAGAVSAVIGTPWEGALVEAALAGGAILSTLAAGERLVAVELGMASGDVYQAYLGAFDPDLARFSLGQEQMLRTIAWCFEAGFSAYDLLAPPDPYKSHWTRGDTAAPMIDVVIPLSMSGRLAAFVETHGRASAKQAAERLPESARAMLARLA